MLHWPGNYPIRETMRAMEKLVSLGMVRFIGVANFDLEELMEGQAALQNEPITSNQVLYHLLDRGIERRCFPSVCGKILRWLDTVRTDTEIFRPREALADGFSLRSALDTIVLQDKSP